MIYIKKNYTKQNVEEEEKIVYVCVFVCVCVFEGWQRYYDNDKV
jgi:hypothetical protein